jgi:hypothetical protein
MGHVPERTAMRTFYFPTIIAVVLVAAFLTPNGLPAQIPNAGFENWTDDEPDGWLTDNDPPDFMPVTKTSSARSGSWALKGESVSYSGYVFPPFVISGSDGEGFPYTGRPEALHGYYRFDRMGEDKFMAFVVLEREDSVLVGFGLFVDSLQVTTYRKFSVNITYTSEEAPDVALIWFTIVPPTETGSTTAGSAF